MDKNTLLGWVVKGWKPTVEQVKAWMNSYRHIDDAIPMSAVENLEQTLNSKANVQSVNDAIAQEATARSNADAILEENINTVDADLTAEIQSRINADNQLLAGIDNEVTQRAQALIDLKSEILNGSPEQLDTLKEISEALGNDPNLSATMMQLIGDRISKPANPTAGKILKYDGNNWVAGNINIPTSVYYLDSDAVADSDTDKTYKTFTGFLSSLDAGVFKTYKEVVSSISGGTNSINVFSSAGLYIGQYVSFYSEGAGQAFPLCTRILEISGNTVTLNNNSSYGISPASIRFWTPIIVKTDGKFTITGSINRPGVTYVTDSGAKIFSRSVKIVEYTYADYVFPQQTLRGNWNIALSNTSSFILYNFTTDIGVTNPVYNFSDEWDCLYSTSSSIPILYYSNNAFVKIILKYKTLITSNTNIFQNYTGQWDSSPNMSLYVEHKYSYGYLGGFSIRGCDNFYISNGILETPNGINALNIQSDGRLSNKIIDTDILSGNVSIQAIHCRFNGNIRNSLSASFFGGQGSYSYDMIFGMVIYGNIQALNIYINSCTTYGKLTASSINLSGDQPSNIYGTFQGYINSTCAHAIIYGNAASTLSLNVTGGILKFKGNGGDWGYSSHNISNGTLVIEGETYNGYTGYNVNAGGVLIIEHSASLNTYNWNQPLINIYGGKVILKGRLNQGGTSPAIIKSAGKLVIKNGVICCNIATNPIKIISNTTEARTLHITEAYTNCDGFTNSILNTFDTSGNTFAPISKFGAKAIIIEDTEVE